MAFDDDVYELRREKLKKIEALGQATYRSKFEFTHTIEKILANYTALRCWFVALILNSRRSQLQDP